MSSTNNIWAKLKEKKEAKAAAAASSSKKGEAKISTLPDEMKAEIQAMREKKKNFDASNEIGSYAVIIFSCEADRKKFVQGLKCKKIAGEVFLDGYEVAKSLNLEPQKPSVKLPPPLDTTRMRND